MFVARQEAHTDFSKDRILSDQRGNNRLNIKIDKTNTKAKVLSKESPMDVAKSAMSRKVSPKNREEFRATQQNQVSKRVCVLEDAAEHEVVLDDGSDPFQSKPKSVNQNENKISNKNLVIETETILTHPTPLTPEESDFINRVNQHELVRSPKSPRDQFSKVTNHVRLEIQNSLGIISEEQMTAFSKVEKISKPKMRSRSDSMIRFSSQVDNLIEISEIQDTRRVVPVLPMIEAQNPSDGNSLRNKFNSFSQLLRRKNVSNSEGVIASPIMTEVNDLNSDGALTTIQSHDDLQTPDRRNSIKNRLSQTIEYWRSLAKKNPAEELVLSKEPSIEYSALDDRSEGKSSLHSLVSSFTIVSEAPATAPVSTQNFSVEQIRKIINEMVESCVEVISRDQIDVRVQLQGSQAGRGMITISEFSTAPKEYNITFSNFDEATSKLLAMNIAQLRSQLKAKDIVCQKIEFTVSRFTVDLSEMSHSDSSPSTFRHTSDDQPHKQKQKEREKESQEY